MATLNLSTDRQSYNVGDPIVATLTVSGLEQGEGGWEKVAHLVGSLRLSSGELVGASGDVTVTKADVPAETATNPAVSADGVAFTLESFDGTTAVLRGVAA